MLLTQIASLLVRGGDRRSGRAETALDRARADLPYWYVRLWHGETMSAENSQHIADWYTPSHIIHGLVFYAVLWLVARRLPFGWRLVIAALLEATWDRSSRIRTQ